MFKKIKSLGIDLTDGVWGLIEANAGILLRCGTVTRNNHIREFGLGVACGESGWAVNHLKFAFQQLAILLFGYDENAPYMKWHIVDNGLVLPKVFGVF